MKTFNSSQSLLAILALTLSPSLQVLCQEGVNVSFKGDETSLVRVESSPRDYINRLFIICGDLKTESFYNYGYRNAEGSHYSFNLHERKDDSSQTYERAFLYLNREIGKKVSDLVVEAQEKSGSGDGLFARVTVTIARDRFEAGGSDFFEVVNVQFPKKDGSGWDEGLVQWPEIPVIEKRVWTDTKGREINAKFKGIERVLDSGLALLEKENGETIKINQMWLSKSDCDYIRETLAQEERSAFHPSRFDQQGVR